MPSFQLTFSFKHPEDDLRDAVQRYIGVDAPFRILKKSIDARNHNVIRVHYTITTELLDPAESISDQVKSQISKIKNATRSENPLRRKIIIVGSGPGGIFCAYWLALHGFKPILLEQGPRMRQRILDMAAFMKKGALNPHSNICMGAGGAGTYSDGKLITRIRSPYIPFVMDTFVKFGAPEEIKYLYNPHLGSNKIRHCITSLLAHLEDVGVEMRYETEFKGFVTDARDTIGTINTSRGEVNECDALFLAIGHSSRATYSMLRKNHVTMECKPYAVGVRVEHPARCINEMQYGEKYQTQYEGIETAQYKFSQTWEKENRSVYSFCMCPGGFVLNASTDEDGVVTNGMSNYAKAGRFSNSGIVVNVSLADLEREGYSGIDGGLEFQKEIEARFRAAVNKQGSFILPAQRLVDFLDEKKTTEILSHSSVNPVAAADLHALLPKFIFNGLMRGFAAFDRKMRSFSMNPDAQLFAVESRTSSPYRIVRDEKSLTSKSHHNMYPIGEGAGYAGGITSAAVDGIKCAQVWIEGMM